MKQVYGVMLLGALLALAGCQTLKPIAGTKSSDESIAALERALEETRARQEAPAATGADAMQPPSLLPPLQLPAVALPVQERFDITAEDLAARDFFMGLVQGTDYNMIVHAEVTGSISLNLKKVTVDEVMQAVRRVYGYEYRKSGNLYQVLPATLQTEMFQIDYLDIKRQGVSDTLVSAGSVREAGASGGGGSDGDSEDGSASAVTGTRIKTQTAADFWSGLKETLQAIVSGEGRQVVVNPQTGLVLVRALPSELDVVRHYLDQSELTLHRQVVLEAKVLEITLSNRFQAGVNWGLISERSNGEFIQFSQTSATLANPDGIGGIFRGELNLGDFTAVLDLLGTQGDVQVLSSPRVSTVNNQKAVIKVGTDEFFVTEIENTTTTGGTAGTTTSPKVELTAFFSGIALDVTPQISADGAIVLHIHPTVSEVKDQTKVIDVGTDTFNLPTAFSSIRESDSVVRAQSGQVIVIGGLMKARNEDTHAGVPGLSALPGIGNLFKQQRQQGEKTELVILLRPVLAGQQSWQNELQRSLEMFKGLRQTSLTGNY